MKKLKELSIVKGGLTLIIMFLSTIVLFAQDVTLDGPSGCGSNGISDSWTVPCDVTSITVEVYGGGGGAGGGGGGSDGGFNNTRGGGGAGGGGYSIITIDVTPGSVFTYSAAAGGCGGSNGSDFNDGDDGGSGGNSTFSGTDAGGTAVNLAANGGVRGTGGESGNDDPGSGGGGGTASGGSTNTPGISGSNGSGGSGGAGGSGAGPNGGIGGAPNSGNGSSYAGGGAGGGNSSGGIGAAGGILITYVTQGDFTPVVVIAAASCLGAGTVTISNYNTDATYAFTPVGPAAGGGGVVSGMVASNSYTVISTIGSCVSPSSQPFSIEEQLDGPVISISGMLEYCSGSTATITGGGGQTYTWDDPSNSSTASIDVAQGTYTVTGADSNGCTGSSTVVVVEVVNPTVDIGEDQQVCGQATVTLDAGSGPISFNWSSGDDTQTAELGSGTQWVEVSNGTCTASDTIVIVANLNPEPLISPAGNQTVCDGGTVTLDAGDGYVSYLWSPGAEDTQTVIVSTGSYSAIVTDANGCVGYSDTVQITLENITAPVLSPSGPINICDGDSVTIDAGGGYDTYIWSTGDTTQTITVSENGDYNTAVTLGTCLEKSDTVEVIVNSVLVAIIENGTELSVDGSFSSYQWLLNGSPIPGGNSQTHTATTSGNYTVQVTDSNGCVGLSFVLEYTLPSSINELEAPLPFVVYPNPSNGQFQFVMEMNEPYTIEVMNAMGQRVYEDWNPNGNRTEINLEATGPYLIQVTVKENVYHKRIVVQ
jgi:hypothetical protein